MAETLYIIDGHSQIFRAYYAPFRDLTSPTGEPTRATYVFSNMLLKFIADRKPTYLAMAVDGPRKELKRTDIYPEYKAHRKPIPEDFSPQEKRIFQIVETLGIPILKRKGYEADDIMATAAELFASDDLQVVLVSRDKDLDQVVGANIVLYDPMKDEFFDAEAIESKKGYSPDKSIEIQTLTGDSTDNIPGIPGIGPKTALKLIKKYGTANAVVAAAEEQTPKLKQNLLEHGPALELTRQLVTLDRSVPLDLKLQDLKLENLHFENLGPIFAELGFNKLIDRLEQLSGKEIDASTEEIRSDADTAETTAADFDYRLINTPEGLAEIADELKNVKRIAVDTETTGLQPLKCALAGICLSWKPGHGVYLPVKTPMMEPALDEDLVRDTIGPILADRSVEMIGHNLKFDMLVLQNAGYELAGPMFDTMIAAHVIDSTRMSYKMDALAMDLLRHRCIPIEDVIGRGKKQVTIDTVPTDIVARYAAEDADVTLRMADILSVQLKENNLQHLFEDLEMKLMPVLAKMEKTGIRVIPERLKKMEAELSREAEELHRRIIDAAGVDFNPDSPKQLAEILFTELGLPVIKKNKSGPSTDSDVLQQLAAEYECPIPELVLDYRKLTKLVGTYLKSLARCIHSETGRVHTSFHQASVATGRLSSSDPNLQNIPIRTDRGKQIRSAFTADDGYLLLSADYSQIELRMLAHFCEDETMCQAFENDIDIHTLVAAEVFGVPMDEVTSRQRDRAKTVNFGIIYGQTSFGLAKTLRISRGEAGEFITSYKARFPRIDEFLQACIRQARENGYIETIFGRRRKIAEIDAKNVQRRNLAERLAINSVVQGSAADLIKQAMLNISKRIDNENRPARMLLQIHDELIFEIPEKDVEAEREMIVSEMTGAIELSIPLKVDTGTGTNWLDAK